MSRGRTSGAAGSGSHEQQLDEVDEELPNDDVPMERAGSDQKVDMGFAGRWRALENAWFIPKEGDSRQLMNDIIGITECDPGALRIRVAEERRHQLQIHRAQSGHSVGDQA